MLDGNRDVNGGEAAMTTAHVGRGWREIDRQMRRIAKRRAELDAEEARLLVAAKRAEIHVHLGYGSFTEYLERVCGHAPRTARERLRVAEALEDLPMLREALDAGDVSFSAVKELTRVVTPETEEVWLGAVERCTVREIEDAVRGRHLGDLPDDRPDPAIETRTVKLEMTPETYALFLEARRKLEQETGDDMTDSDFMAAACRRVLAGESIESSNQPTYRVAVTVCRDCGRGWQETGSKSIELSPSALDRARCDAVELGNVDGDTPEPTTRTIPAPIRRAVLARDRHRCRIPGCRSSLYVDVHHLKRRTDGGTHEMSNLVTLCSRHHTAAHDGRILIQGPPSALLVTHADGRLYGALRTENMPTDLRVTSTGAPPIRTKLQPFVASASGRPHCSRSSTGREPQPPVADEVRQALVSMGLKHAEAARAVEAATAHVGRDPSLESLLRAALRACIRPRT